MKLLLIKHSKPSWSIRNGISDLNRPLSGQGKRDNILIAGYLANLGQEVNCIISSPAKKAVSFAKDLSISMQSAFFINKRLYKCSVSDLIAEINQLILGLSQSNLPTKGEDTIALVCHDPALSKLATALLNQHQNDNEMDIKMPTSSVLALQSDKPEFDSITHCKWSLEYFIYPEEIQRTARTNQLFIN